MNDFRVGDDTGMRLYPALRVSLRHPPVEFMDLVAAALDDFGVIAIEETDDGSIQAFISDAHQRDAASEAVRRMLPDATITSRDVPDDNWAERSQAALRAIRAGALTVAPPWDVPLDASGQVIVIVPSTGFGTGHHATTRLCLEALQRAPVGGASVLDAGTGSGVLAIAAAKRGAQRVVAIDNDPDAVANAAENAALNDAQLDLRVAPLEGLENGVPFDVVTANLTGATLVKYASKLEALSSAAATLILSGLRGEEEQDVRRAFRRCRVVGRESDDGWVCLVMRRSQA